jgi:phage-related protein
LVNYITLQKEYQGFRKMAAIIEGIISAIMGIVSALVEAIGKIVEGVAKVIIEAVKSFSELIFGVGKALFSGLQTVTSSLGEYLSKLSMPSISFDFVTNVFGRRTDIKIFQLDASDLLKDQTVSLVMQKLKVGQPLQSLATVLYVGGKAGVEAGCKKYEKTGNINKSIEVARKEAAIKATSQTIREIPNFADAGSPMANYVEGKICDKVADGAEHELRMELSRRRV